MNKKILIPVIILIAFTTLVSATMNILEEYTTGNEYNVELNIEEGWTIVSGLYDVRGIKGDSEIKRDDIKVIWYYSPIQKKYLQMHPNMNDEEFEGDISYYRGDDPIMTSSMWIYSEKSGTLKYSTIRYDKLDKRKVAQGWNLVGITPEMIGKDLDGIKGDCDVTSLYHWSPRAQSFINALETFDHLMRYNENAGYGFIMKVSNDCTLGLSSQPITAPPSLPN